MIEILQLKNQTLKENEKKEKNFCQQLTEEECN